MAFRHFWRRCSRIGSYYLENAGLERQPAAEGQIPWKGLKPSHSKTLPRAPQRRRRANSLEGIETSADDAIGIRAHAAAEGQIPWKGLKPSVSTAPAHAAPSAELRIPWEGLKQSPAYLRAARVLTPQKGKFPGRD